MDPYGITLYPILMNRNKYIYGTHLVYKLSENKKHLGLVWHAKYALRFVDRLHGIDSYIVLMENYVHV